MVRLDENALNRIFETLSDWEHILQSENIDLVALADAAPKSEDAPSPAGEDDSGMRS